MNEKTRKLLAKFLLDLAHQMAGNSGLAIISALLSNGPMRDEDLARVTGMNVLTIRGIVSQFISAGFVTYFEQRARSNWVDYYFFIDQIGLRAAMKERFLKVLSLVQGFLQSINANELQWCDQCRLFYRLEESVLTEGGDVLCPVCGSHLKECLDFAEQLNNHLSDIIKKLRELWRYI